MNGLKLTSLITFMLASVAGFSFNPVQGWYAGAVGGGTYVPNVNLKIINPLDNAEQTGQLDYLLGGNGAGFLGYRLCHLRLELEVLANDNKFKNLQIGNYSLTDDTANLQGNHMSGYTYFVAGIANAIYEFYQPYVQKTNYAPYLGLGLGYANVRSGLKISSTVNTIGSASTSSDAFMGQAIVGLNYFMDDFLAVGIDYRYMILSKTSSITNYYQPQTINLSFTYAFGK